MWLSKPVSRAVAGLACLALLFGAALYGGGNAPAAEAAEVEPPPPVTAVRVAEVPAPEPAREYEPALTLRTGGRLHAAYLSAGADGLIRPDDPLTRGEAALLLYWLLEEEPPARAQLRDVPADAPYAGALELLAAYDVVRCPGGMARPEQNMTRAEFTAALSRFFPGDGGDCNFTDLPPCRADYAEVAKGVEMGWINGYDDGSFRPDAPITRAEAATVVNRALGREADREYIDTEIILPLWPDLTRAHWAYYALTEAAADHARASDGGREVWTALNAAAAAYPEGPVLIGTDLYYVGAGGTAVTDAEAGGFYFGPDGRYTSGDAEIDGYVQSVLSSLAEPEMTREELLHASYNYTRDNFSYLRRHYYQTGDTGWTLEEGRTMFRTGRGNCYCYASVFYYLARQLGYDATAVSGTVGHNRSPHSWVEIDFDGVTYIFDTELEMSYLEKGNHRFDFYMMPYSRAPWPYRK